MSGNALGRRLSSAFAVLIAAATLTAADAGPSKADAASLRQKVATINWYAVQPAARNARRQPRRTLVTQNEVNAYLAYDAGDRIPDGIVEPALTILGGGRVTARAVVDLDAVRKQKQRTLFDPMNWVSGRVPVTATGVLQTNAGLARVSFESAAIGRLPVPKLILQEIVSYYSRSPENPAGIGLDDAYMLPSGITEIQVEVGRAIVVQ